MGEKKFKWRFIFRSNFQYGMIALLALACALGCLVTHAFYYFGSASDPSETKVSWVLAGGVALFLALTAYALVLTNRLAGPLPRAIRHMKAIARGDARPPLKFRAKDFHPELAEAFNEVAAQLEEATRNNSTRSG